MDLPNILHKVEVLLLIDPNQVFIPMSFEHPISFIASNFLPSEVKVACKTASLDKVGSPFVKNVPPPSVEFSPFEIEIDVEKVKLPVVCD